MCLLHVRLGRPEPAGAVQGSSSRGNALMVLSGENNLWERADFMAYRPDTPLRIVLEMHAIVLAGPALTAVILSCVLLMLWKMRSANSTKLADMVRQFVSFLVILIAVPAMWLGFVLGTLTVLDHPSYRQYVECDPCF